MDYQLFKIRHSDVIMCYQLIEHDLKFIYSRMLEGDFDENFDSIKKETLGSIVRLLEDLDKTDKNQWISDDDYKFLKSIVKDRNFWAHENYLEFAYLGDNFMNTKQFKKQYDKLESIHDKMLVVQRNVEKVRLKVCSDLV